MRLRKSLSALLACGRTVSRLSTLASPQEIETIAEQYGRLDVTDSEWISLSRTERLDVVATSILKADRDRQREVLQKYKGNYSAKAANLREQTYGFVLGEWQWGDRSRREVLLEDLDFLDRNFHWTEWHWYEGGWYGDAPRIIQEVYPKFFDGMPRSRPDERVGILRWKVDKDP